jgi:hypothetical protein
LAISMVATLAISVVATLASGTSSGRAQWIMASRQDRTGRNVVRRHVASSRSRG